MESSVVTVKGQIVIPFRLRKQAGIKAGTRVYLEAQGNDIVIHPATEHFYEGMKGLLKGAGLVKELEASRRKEKARENRRA